MKLKLKEGWILAPSENDPGVMAPFIVHTFSKAIVWRLKDKFSTKVMNLIKDKEIVEDYALSKVSFKENNLEVIIYSDNTFTINSRVALTTSNFVVQPSNQSIATRNIVLPFEVKNVTTNIIIDTEYENLSYVIPTITLSDNSVLVRLCNTKNNFTFDNSSTILITISGKLK